MAALTAVYATLLDLARRLDPNGQIAAVAEVLDETNEIMADMIWTEGNLPTGHRTTIRTGLPAPTWRKLYQFTQPTKSTTVQVTDSVGMLEAYSIIDKALADLNGNTAAFRFSEDRPHIAGLSQEIADTIFYGNESTEPEAFTGLGPRFNDTTAQSGDNIIAGGGSGDDNGSIWLIVWGENTCHGIIPKGSRAGIQITDKGQQTVQDTVGGTTGRMEAYVTHFRWDAGITVRDWRYIVRIANIDKSALTRTYTSGAFSAGANLPDLMFQAMRLIPNLAMGTPVFYMSRDMATWVARQTTAMGQGGLITVDPMSGDQSVAGARRFTERFHGIPMRRVDALAGDEATVS